MTGAIVFDLDGTLIDSAPDIAAAANRMLADIGQPPLDLATVTRFIGNGIPNLVRLVMEARGIPADQHPAMNDRMLAHYTAHPADLSRPYPGVVAALEAFRAAGYRLGVCTNKLHAPSMQILNALDLTRHFAVVIGGDSLPVKKPDPAPLHAAFSALGEAALYVGDSEVDAETAANAGIRFALFTLGYRKTPVEELPHAFAFDDFTTLPGLIGVPA
ncbi:MAG: phosphoglycolate phosphatase [Rhodobacter sp.]|nr:phosphoglycolate phosphatase [Rhodobacter sp.]